MKKKRALPICICFIFMICIMSGCKNGTEVNNKTDINKGKLVTFAFVAKEAQNPYMKKMYDGFQKACKEVGVKPLFMGPKEANSEMQIEIINKLISEKVSGIAIAANDANALQTVLTKAMKSGIKVISLDSPVNAKSRQIHIEQADPEKIGRGLIQAAYEMVNGNGGIAILSTTAQSANQNLWISWMKKEMKDHPDKYANTPLITIQYGDDNDEKSEMKTEEILKNRNVKIIIAPTTVGMFAAAKVIQSSNSDVLLTGLGLPSEMAPYVQNGICPWMYLWNPIDVGYLAAYTMDSLQKGTITGVEGDIFEAGTLGQKVVTNDFYGGTEVLLGDPFKFDSTNIDEWKNIY